MIALEWESKSNSRKLVNYQPRLAVIEMKTGDGALSGKHGLSHHYKDLEQFLADPDEKDRFRKEMLQVFQQKRDLGLIPTLKNHPEVKCVADRVDVIFLLANHNPDSRKLKDAVDKIREKHEKDQPNFNVYFAMANFMGFGLYSQNILSLDDFEQQLEPSRPNGKSVVNI